MGTKYYDDMKAQPPYIPEKDHDIEGEERSLKQASQPTQYNMGRLWEHIEKLQKRVAKLESTSGQKNV